MYTNNESLKKHKNFKEIKASIEQLISTGIVNRLPGNCVAACDVLQNILSFHGIPSKIIECHAIAMKKNSKELDFCFVGFDDVNSVHNNLVDSHVVIITQTDVPILIDASIGHLLTNNVKIIVQEIQKIYTDIIAEVVVEDIKLTYSQKKNIKLPSIHQKNMVERIKQELEVKKKMDLGFKIIITIACFSLINFTANTILIFLKLMWP